MIHGFDKIFINGNVKLILKKFPGYVPTKASAETITFFRSFLIVIYIPPLGRAYCHSSGFTNIKLCPPSDIPHP